MAFAVNQLTGRARLWGTVEWERKIPACASFELFSAEIRKVLSQGARSTDAGGLLRLHHREQLVADFAIDFRTRHARAAGTRELSATPFCTAWPTTLRMSWCPTHSQVPLMALLLWQLV